MSEWTKEQIKIVMKASTEADGGCGHCIEAVLHEFLNLTSWDLIELMDEVSSEVNFHYYNWEDCRPWKRDWEKSKDE